MKFVIIVFFLLFSTHSYAGCWVVGNFAGYSAMEAEQYNISPDGLSNQTFIVFIEGKAASISGNDIQFIAVAPTIAVGVNNGTVETWTVAPETGHAVYTQTRSGFGPLNGGKLLIGKILKTC